MIIGCFSCTKLIGPTRWQKFPILYQTNKNNQLVWKLIHLINKKASVYAPSYIFLKPQSKLKKHVICYSDSLSSNFNGEKQMGLSIESMVYVGSVVNVCLMPQAKHFYQSDQCSKRVSSLTLTPRLLLLLERNVRDIAFLPRQQKPAANSDAARAALHI